MGAPADAWVPFRSAWNYWSSLVFIDQGVFSSDYPPQDTFDMMFKAPSQSGYGIEKTSWFWGLADIKTADDCWFGG